MSHAFPAQPDPPIEEGEGVTVFGQVYDASLLVNTCFNGDSRYEYDYHFLGR
jgi:hypothetical protein